MVVLMCYSTARTLLPYTTLVPLLHLKLRTTALEAAQGVWSWQVHSISGTFESQHSNYSITSSMTTTMDKKCVGSTDQSIETVALWDNRRVVAFVEEFCATREYSEAVSSSGMNGKALLYMTTEGWIELGMTNFSHRHMLIGWSKHVLNDNPRACSYESSVRREPRRIIQRSNDNEKHHLQMLHEMKHLHPDAVPVTHDRVFYPSLVKDNYPLVGKAFLKVCWNKQHFSYNKSMNIIRGWFKEGFGDLGRHEFTQINLRKDPMIANNLMNFIKRNMHELKTLVFSKDVKLDWRAKDVYEKVLEWRHAQRNPKKNSRLVNLEGGSSLRSPLTIDTRRQRCYPSYECSIEALEGTSMLQFMKSALHLEDSPKMVSTSSSIKHGHIQACGENGHFEESFIHQSNDNSYVNPTSHSTNDTHVNEDRRRQPIMGTFVQDCYTPEPLNESPNIMSNDSSYVNHVNEDGGQPFTNDNHVNEDGGQPFMETFVEDCYIPEPPNESANMTARTHGDYMCETLLCTYDKNPSKYDMLIGLGGAKPFEKEIQTSFYNIPLHKVTVLDGKEATLDVVEKSSNMSTKINEALVEVEKITLDESKMPSDVHKSNLDKTALTHGRIDYEVDEIALQFADTNTRLSEYPFQKGKDMRFASINKMMAFDGHGPTKQNVSNKRKAFHDLTNHRLSSPKKPSTTRSSRTIKTPSRFKDMLMENAHQSQMSPIAKKQTTEKIKMDTCTLSKFLASTKQMRSEELITIAMKTMGLHDVDVMFGDLWKVIKEARRSNKSFFKDCSMNMDQSLLLQYYVAWIRFNSTHSCD